MRALVVIDQLDSPGVVCLIERGRGVVPCCGPFIRLAVSNGGPLWRRSLSRRADLA